jgi:hypothetical protein
VKAYNEIVVDSYTGLTWCGRGLHLLEEGVNASRRKDGHLKCLPCEARTTRERRKRARRVLVDDIKHLRAVP